MKNKNQLIANRCAKNFGTNRATQIKELDPKKLSPLAKDVDAGKVSLRVLPRVLHYDRYHAESRTGIRASMAALKRFWSTYHYVPTECVVAVADSDSVYNNDNH